MGFLKIFPLSDVNFIITWLITPSIFWVLCQGLYLISWYLHAVREKFGPLLFGEYTGKTLRKILSACAASFFVDCNDVAQMAVYNKPDLTIERNYTLFGRHDTRKA